MEEKVDIRVVLEGDIASKFCSLKEKYGLKNNTEVVRRLIMDVFESNGGEAVKCPA